MNQDTTTGGELIEPPLQTHTPLELIINGPEPFNPFLNNESASEKKIERKRKPWVYKAEYDALARDRDLWKKAFIGSVWVSVALIIFLIFTL